jgi:hypothetical protein
VALRGRNGIHPSSYPELIRLALAAFQDRHDERLAVGNECDAGGDREVGET